MWRTQQISCSLNVLVVVRIDTGPWQIWGMLEKTVFEMLPDYTKEILKNLKQYCLGSVPLFNYPCLFCTINLTFQRHIWCMCVCVCLKGGGNHLKIAPSQLTWAKDGFSAMPQQ